MKNDLSYSPFHSFHVNFRDPICGYWEDVHSEAYNCYRVCVFDNTEFQDSLVLPRHSNVHTDKTMAPSIMGPYSRLLASSLLL